MLPKCSHWCVHPTIFPMRTWACGTCGEFKSINGYLVTAKMGTPLSHPSMRVCSGRWTGGLWIQLQTPHSSGHYWTSTNADIFVEQLTLLKASNNEIAKLCVSIHVLRAVKASLLCLLKSTLPAASASALDSASAEVRKLQQQGCMNLCFHPFLESSQYQSILCHLKSKVPDASAEALDSVSSDVRKLKTKKHATMQKITTNMQLDKQSIPSLAGVAPNQM